MRRIGAYKAGRGEGGVKKKSREKKMKLRAIGACGFEEGGKRIGESCKIFGYRS